MGIIDQYPWLSVAGKYPDVFPNELPQLPSNREIEFNINLVLGPQYIFITPYCMVPVELAELNVGNLYEKFNKTIIQLKHRK